MKIKYPLLSLFLFTLLACGSGQQPGGGPNTDFTDDDTTEDPINECAVGFAGAACDECAVGFAGAACDACAVGFAGAACDACATGYAGANCDACAVGYTGAACDTCAVGFAGATCSTCAVGYTGAACDECADGYAGAACDPCAVGYAGAACAACADGYQDDNNDGVCQPGCDATGELAYDCGVHGDCAVDAADGSRYCACDVGFVVSGGVCVLSSPPSTGMWLWLDADHPASVTLEQGGVLVGGGTPVTSWRDKRTDDYWDFKPPAATNRPSLRANALNGRRVVRFDGVDDFLVDTLDYGWFEGEGWKAYTMFFVGFAKGNIQVFLSGTNANDPGLLVRSTNVGDNLYFMHRSPINHLTGSQDVLITTSGAYSRTAAHLFSVFRAPGFHAASLGRGSEDLESINTSTPVFDKALTLTLGRRSPSGTTPNFLNGDLAEIIIYNRALTTAEIAQVQGYLVGKWGLE